MEWLYKRQSVPQLFDIQWDDKGSVTSVKRATTDGVINVKAASDCQTSHCGSTPAKLFDNRFEGDTVCFRGAAL